MLEYALLEWMTMMLLFHSPIESRWLSRSENRQRHFFKRMMSRNNRDRLNIACISSRHFSLLSTRFVRTILFITISLRHKT